MILKHYSHNNRKRQTPLLSPFYKTGNRTVSNCLAEVSGQGSNTQAAYLHNHYTIILSKIKCQALTNYFKKCSQTIHLQRKLIL